MKRLFILLLIACSAITTASADPTAAAPQRKPENVIRIMNTLIDRFGAKERQIYSVNRNPITGTIESSLRAVTFYCDAPGSYIPQVVDCFTKDEPLSYQFMHLTNSNEQKVIVDVLTNNGQNNTQVHVRSSKDEELWFMCIKNPENPQLRDVYAISWKYVENRKVASGSVYMITSLRPDLYQKNMSSAGLLSENQNTFTIDGRVGYDLKDSLYVVYMADTAEELDKVGDNDYVATMPVVNKRFSFSVQLDKPKVGRIRTVMPDGSLCELWTNLDFVPGETYRITTHNGYYDEDRDYEQRVGRYSGKSLLNDLQRRGIDDQTFTVVDEVPEEFRTAENNVNQGGISTLSVSQNAVLFAKAELVKLHIDKVKNSYQMMGAAMKDNFRSRERVQLIFKQILQQNKELDKQYQEFIKYIRYTGAFSSREWSDMYKEILKFYTEQNQGLSEAYKDSITNGRPILKLRDYLNKQTEKYMKEMSKVMTEN